MKRTLCLSLVGLLALPLPSLAADAVSASTPIVTNKVKSAITPVKNQKLLDAAKTLKASNATPDDSGTTTTVPGTYNIAIEAPSLVQDPNTCAYTWNVRIHNTGTAPVPAGELSVVTQAIKQDYSHVGPSNTIPLGAIEPGASYPVGASLADMPSEAVSFLIAVQKGPENMGSTNYPLHRAESCQNAK